MGQFQRQTDQGVNRERYLLFANQPLNHLTNETQTHLLRNRSAFWSQLFLSIGIFFVRLIYTS